MTFRACLPKNQGSAHPTNNSMSPQLMVDLARVVLVKRHNRFPVQAKPLGQRGM